MFISFMLQPIGLLCRKVDVSDADQFLVHEFLDAETRERTIIPRMFDAPNGRSSAVQFGRYQASRDLDISVMRKIQKFSILFLHSFLKYPITSYCENLYNVDTAAWRFTITFQAIPRASAMSNAPLNKYGAFVCQMKSTPPRSGPTD